MTPEPNPPPAEQTAEPDGEDLGAGIDWADPNSPLARFYLTASGVVAVAVLGVALVLYSLFPLNHTDFWAHLKYGEWIAANRAMPDREPLGEFTDKDSPFFDALWLSQLTYHTTFRLGGALAGGDDRSRFEGGVELIRLLHLFATVAAVGLIGLACRRASGSVPWAAVGMLIVVVLMFGPLGIQRPQAFALAGFAAVLCAISRETPTRRSVVWVPLLVVLWANLHGSFVVGIGLLGAAMLGRALAAGWSEGRSVRAAWRDLGVRRLAAALVLSAAGAGLLNPYGPGIYAEVVSFGAHPNLKTVVEWQPLDFSQSRGGHWGYLATVVFLALTQLASPRWFSPIQVLLIATLGVWPLLQQRAMAWWAPAVVWIAAPHWVAAAERFGLKLPASVPSFRKTALAAVIAVMLLVVSPATTWVKTGQPRPTVGSLHRGTPNDVADALAGRTPANPKRVEALVRAVGEDHGGRFVGRVFASETQGDYLLWALPPDSPVLMFNHPPAFDPAFWSNCLAVKGAAPGWQEFLDRHSAAAVVVEIDSSPALCARLRAHPGWRVVVDEANTPVGDGRSRLFVALRKPAKKAGAG